MHFTQFLNEFEGINIYYSTVYQLLSQAEVDSPKIQKATRGDRTKAKYRLKHPEAAKTETEQAADLSLVHKYVSSILGTYHPPGLLWMLGLLGRKHLKATITSSIKF